jgi:ribosome assembly protein SQT1
MMALSGHLGPVTCGAFVADGRRLVTVSEDGSAFVWELKASKALHHIKGAQLHEGPVTALAVDAERESFVTGGADGVVALCSAETGKVLQRLRGHGDGVEAVALCPSQPWIASGSVDGEVAVWDARSGSRRFAFRHEHAVTRVRWRAAEPVLVTASLDALVHEWDARAGQRLRTFRGHDAAVLDVALHADGKRVVTASEDHTCLVFSSDAAAQAGPRAPRPGRAAARGLADEEEGEEEEEDARKDR